MYVINVQSLLSLSYLGRASAEGEEGEEEKWDGVGCCVGWSVGQIRYHQ